MCFIGNLQDAYARFDRLLQNIQLSPQSRKNLIPTGVVGSGTSITNGSASPAATTSRSGANRSTGSVVGSSKNSKNSAVSKTANATYRNPSSFQASGSDCEASTFEQLMGELHMNGGCGGFRKRNWDRNGRPTSDDRSASIANYWSKLPDAPVWPSDGNNYIQHSPYRNMVPPGDGSAASSRESAVVRPPRGDAKDLTFWTNVFFKNGNDVSPTILHPPRVHTTPNKDRHHQQRKSAASSLVMGLLDTSPTSTTPNETGDQIGATAMNGGHSSSSSTPSRTTSSYLYADGGLNAASSFDYAAIQSGIKRKNNLSKSKVANGPPDRFAKTTDLFLLPSGGSGVYSTLGMPDVSPSTDGSRFIQVGFCSFLLFILFSYLCPYCLLLDFVILFLKFFVEISCIALNSEILLLVA